MVVRTVVRARTARPALGRLGRSGCYVMHAPVAHHQVFDRDVNVCDQLLRRGIVRFRIGLVHLDSSELFHVIETRLGAGGHHHRPGKQTGQRYNMLFHGSRNVFRLERKVCAERQSLRSRVITVVHTDRGSSADSLRIHTPIRRDAEEVVERNIYAQA